MKAILCLLLPIAFLAGPALYAADSKAEKQSKRAERMAEMRRRQQNRGDDRTRRDEEAVKPKPIPFHGEVTAVDPTARTFTFKGINGKDRVFAVPSGAVVMKDNFRSDFGAITPGAYATGQYTRTDAGQQQALMVKLGPKPAGLEEDNDPKRPRNRREARREMMREMMIDDAKMDEMKPGEPKAPAKPAEKKQPKP